MLKLDTYAVIITRDVVWINKMYWSYMGISNKQKYNIQEDKDDNTSIINLIEDNNIIEDTINKKQDKKTQNHVCKKNKHKNNNIFPRFF